jgi:CubicO group peptidase (beta-lactamase class C family)
MLPLTKGGYKMTSTYKKSIFFATLIIILCSIGGCTLKESVKSGSTGYWPTVEWRTTTPEAQNMDSTQLEKMDDDLNNIYYQIRSVVIIRNGHIVFEKYYLGDENTSQPIYSATKSIVSALIGIALDKGYIENIDQKVVNYFPEYAEEIADARFNEISIRHLLTMSAGFDNALGKPNKGIKECFGYPITTSPGSEARYNSCATHLLSGIISKSTKMSAQEFGYKELFEPLGIEKPTWISGSEGYTMGGFGLYMTSRDMAKIGHLYLHDGVWDGNQIISANWVKESTQKQSTIKLGTFELSYGYQWWVSSPKGYTLFTAAGMGGQYIYVFPDLDIVAVVTSDSLSFPIKHQGVVSSYCIAAVIK